MDRQYTVVIMSSDPTPMIAVQSHREQLANYKKFGLDRKNADLQKMQNLTPIPYMIKIYEMSTTSAVHGHNFVMVTTMVCENETPAEEARGTREEGV